MELRSPSSHGMLTAGDVDFGDTRQLMVDGCGGGAYGAGWEVGRMNQASRWRALGDSGLVHPNPAAVRAPLFGSDTGFFLAADKVQVKYEMLRAHLVDAQPVTEAAAAHGYSRAAFYLVSASFVDRQVIPWQGCHVIPWLAVDVLPGLVWCC